MRGTSGQQMHPTAHTQNESELLVTSKEINITKKTLSVSMF